MSATLSPIVTAELAKFRSTVDLLQKGAIDPDKEFKPYRLVHGVYGQRQAGENQMVRVKLKYGLVTPAQMRVLADCAVKYSNGNSHISTRQAVQYHYVQLPRTPDLLQELEEAGLTTREACGNAVRAVCASAHAGTRSDEPFAIEPYAEAVFQHFLRGPRSSNLPRKFKISFSGSDADRLGQTNIQDVGATAVVVDGKEGFRVVAAGGLGASPQAPILIAACAGKDELIPLAEAILRVHHQYGDRQNRAKARLKFVLRNHGDEGFRKLVADKLAEVRAEGIRGAVLPDRLPAAAPTPIPAEGDAAERAWRRANVHSHRESGLAVVDIAIRRGDLPAALLKKLADLAEAYSAGDVRTSNDQDLCFRRVPISRLGALHGELAALGLTRPAHAIADVVSCPGASTCQLGVTLSKNLAQGLEDALADLDDEGVRAARIFISGCPNSCGQHHIGTIGLHGAASKVGDKLVPHYVLLVGGGDEGAQVFHSALIARIPARKVAPAIRALAQWYVAERQGGQSFAAWLRAQAGFGLDRNAAAALKTRLKDRLGALCSYQPGELTEADLLDIGADKLFQAQVGELGAGECMA
ncbi:MAG: nitrite/sulfite reductase [Planctomycetes bacterium]|nr:nitrite/sulfite reductase [Planctomycetota bacterium]